MAPLLSPLRELLRDYKLVLASASPQRRKLLEQIGFEFSVDPSPFDEELVSKTINNLPADYLKLVATGKALEVAKKYLSSPEPVLIIGADTIIVHEDEIIGKPHEPYKAKRTLRKLSGQQHYVHTGVCIMVTGGKWTDGGPARSLIRETYFETTTLVKMCELTEDLISSYVESGEPLNKAGAYGIQGLGAVLVHYIKGEYSNVVGLPLNRLCSEITKFMQTLKRS